MSLPPQRRYTEEEARDILRRATELDAGAAGGVEGLTLAELERLATEFGIDPRHVRAAAAGVGARESGAGALLEAERVADAPLSEDAWDAALAELRRNYGAPGESTQVGATREWAHKSDLTRMHAAFSERDGRTRVRLLNNLEPACALSWWLFGLLVFWVALIAGLYGFRVNPALGLWNLLLTGVAAGAGAMGLRLTLQSWMLRCRRRLAGVADRVAAVMEAAAGQGHEAAALPVTPATVEQPLQLGRRGDSVRKEEDWR